MEFLREEDANHIGMSLSHAAISGAAVAAAHSSRGSHATAAKQRKNVGGAGAAAARNPAITGFDRSITAQMVLKSQHVGEDFCGEELFRVNALEKAKE